VNARSVPGFAGDVIRERRELLPPIGVRLDDLRDANAPLPLTSIGELHDEDVGVVRAEAKTRTRDGGERRGDDELPARETHVSSSGIVWI
jgi:hypothetical protein